jgi:hypothetical protein
MLRFTLTAVVLAGVLATAHAASPGPVAVPTDHAQMAGAEQSPPAPASAESGKEIPVGFGWG